MNRGRSRQVSQTAIARNASWERRASLLRPSPSTSPDSDDSMPYDDDDSTESLEDQVHVAYAHDDIHTAKILLLRLKGIHVTDDNDPRIAEVQDEDFDFCFAPHGTLVLDEYHEKAIREQQRLETERMEQYRRIERLRMCEQKWAREKRRLREERMQVLRSREMKRFEEEERRRRREQEQKIRRQQTEARLFQLRTTRVRGERRVLSYTLQQPHSRRPPQNSSDSDSDEERSSLLYDFMIVPPAPRPRRQKPASPPPPPAKSNQRHHLPTPTFDDSCSVSFTEVLQSMQGPLFPLTNEERGQRNQSPATSKARSRSCSKGPTAMSHSQVRRRKESELLQSLLVHPVSSEEDRRRSKGKGKAVVTPRVYGGCSGCRRSPSASSTDLSSPTSPTSSVASSSPSSTTGSRPSSWLSFGSSASVSSAATSPSTSPSRRSSWFKTSTSTSSPSRRGSWLSTALTSPPRSIKRQTSFDEKRCRCQHDHLTPITITDSPLFFESDESTIPPPSPKPYSTSLESVLGGIRIRRPTRTASNSSMTASLLNNMSQTVSASVSSLLELAKGFQQAYVTAAMFSVAAACDGDRWEEREVVYAYDRVKGVRIVQVVRAEGDVYGRAGSRAESINEKAKVRKTKGRMKPVGYRVSPKDVAKFLGVKSCCSCTAAKGSGQENDDAATGDRQKAPNGAVVEGCRHAAPALTPTVKRSKYLEIPLGSPYSPHQTPTTVLPNPLPYELHFKPIPAPTRSPFRFNAFSHIHTTYPDQEGSSEIPDYSLNLNSCSRGTVRGISWRIRSVGNPAHLRLRALQNVLWQNGLSWEGRGREMSIGGGRDRVVGVAYEGVGPSKLSRGPVPVVV